MSPTQNAAAPAPVSRSRVRSGTNRTWLAPALLFLVSTAITQPPFSGDSFAYCKDVARVIRHAAPASSLWDPGHILWRPLAYLSSPVFLALIPDRIAWTPELKIGYGLKLVSLLCGMLAALLIHDLARRLMGSRLAALIPAMLFVWGDSVLAYAQCGTSYVAGLALLIAGLWWQLTRPRGGLAAVMGPAALFGTSALFWLPYAIAVPAACCTGRFVTLAGARRRMTWGEVLLSAGTAGAVAAAGLALGTAMAGVRSFPQWMAWLTSAGHGLRQNRQAIRAIAGCSRLLLDLGSADVYVKRFLFHDPYHPVGALGVVAHSLWRPAAFYLFLAAAVLPAWWSRSGRQSLAPLALAGLPALAAAVLVFEPSAPERFFPVLPFLLLTIAAGWDSAWRPAWLARGFLCLFAALLPVMNAPTFIEAFSGWHRAAARQMTEFRGDAAPGDALVEMVLNEPIVSLETQHPFDGLNRSGDVDAMWAIDFMTAHPEQWPNRVARFVLSRWNDGRAVWVERAALAGRPADRLLWVEGDNPNVHWRDIPAFFSTLDFDRAAGGADGYLRIAHSARNEARLRELASGG